jgi:hypothetical protein
MAVFAVSTVNDSDQVLLPRRVPLSQFLKDSESAFRSRLRKVHLHVDRSILKYLEILLRLPFSWLLERRQWPVDINCLPVPLQGDFMIVARRAGVGLSAADSC